MRLSEIWQQLTTESRYVRPDGSEYFNHPAINFIKRPATMGALTAIFAQAVLGVEESKFAAQIANNIFDLALLAYMDYWFRDKHYSKLESFNTFSKNAVIDRNPESKNVKTSPKNYMAAKEGRNFNLLWLSLPGAICGAGFLSGNIALLNDIYLTGLAFLTATHAFRNHMIVTERYQVLDEPPKKDERLGAKKEVEFALPQPNAA